MLCDQVSELQCCLGRVEPLRDDCADKLGQILNVCLGMSLLEIIILPIMCIPIYQDERENYPSLFPWCSLYFSVTRPGMHSWLLQCCLSHLSCFVNDDHRDRERNYLLSIYTVRSFYEWNCVFLSPAPLGCDSPSERCSLFMWMIVIAKLTKPRTKAITGTHLASSPHIIFYFIKIYMTQFKG